jgi:hypothetical protein
LEIILLNFQTYMTPAKHSKKFVYSSGLDCGYCESDDIVKGHQRLRMNFFFLNINSVFQTFSQTGVLWNNILGKLNGNPSSGSKLRCACSHTYALGKDDMLIYHGPTFPHKTRKVLNLEI